MDTSEQRIKMCEKAVEIQASWKPKFSDIMCSRDDGRIWGIASEGREYYVVNLLAGEDWFMGRTVVYKHNTLAAFIWLPSQDQLQEMVLGSKYHGVHGLSAMIRDFEEWNYGIGFTWLSDGEFTSMEQLWLAFAQKELHGKVWDGEDWVLQ